MRRAGSGGRNRGRAKNGLSAGTPPPPCVRKRGDSHAKRSDRGQDLCWNAGSGQYFRSQAPVTQAHI